MAERAAPGASGIPAGNLRAGLAWYAVAHAALLAAALLVLADPGLLAGPWQRPRLIAVVHLVTLGWIAASILGSLLLLGQGVLRLGLVAGRRELVAAPVWAFFVAGLAAHFALVEPLGMALAAVPLALALAGVAIRVLVRVRRAALPAGMRFAIALAWSDLLLALVAGLTLAGGQLGWAVPGGAAAWRVAHAHLAAAGWATTLVVGVGARMIPMLLPSAPPPQGALAATAAAFGVGTPLLAVTVVAAPAWIAVAAALPLAGALGFGGLAVWMLAHPRPPARELRSPDPARWLALVAMAGLLATAALGAALALGLAPAPSPLAIAYGVTGLVGFLGAMILAVELRLLPTVAWVIARRRLGFDVPFPSTHRLPPYPLALAAAAAFAVAAPALAAGALTGNLPAIRAGAAALAAGPLLHVLTVAAMLWRGRRPGP